MTKPFFFKVDGKHTVLNVFPASTEIRSVMSSESTSLGRPLGFLWYASQSGGISVYTSPPLGANVFKISNTLAHCSTSRCVANKSVECTSPTL